MNSGIQWNRCCLCRGASEEIETFFSRQHHQIHKSVIAGNATGRNIHQKSMAEAIAMCNAITAEIADVAQSLSIYRNNVF